jgi:nicotinamidase-related amidase
MPACLMLLDMQHGILRSGRVPFETAEIPEVAIREAEKLAKLARTNGVPVIHVGVARLNVAGILDQPRTQAARKSGKVPRDILPLAAGTKETEFVVAPQAEEELVYKVGVSAFAGTRAELIIRNLDARDVFVAGAFTHMVVESTVRSGFDLGFRMHAVAGACCAPARAIHEASLSGGIPNFAQVHADVDAAHAAMRACNNA